MINLEPVEMPNGDPGYVADGHLDREEFLKAVMDYELQEGLIDSPEEGFILDDVRHCWRRDASEEEAYSLGFDTFFFVRKSTDPGAKPCTLVTP